MASYADLELGLHPWEEGSYAVELRFSQPNSEAEIRLVQDGPVLVKFDMDALRMLTTDAKEYGKRLYDSLFVADVQKAFAQARNSAQEKEVPLRLRLFIAAKARELHSLRWETLCDPADERFLLMDERVLFSRYVISADWRPVRSRAQEELRTLVVIANPTDLESYKPGGFTLAPLDVPAELAGVRSGLGTMDLVHLSSEPGGKGRATLENLFHCLREGYDILYLVCHGALIRGEPRLWLENEQGNVDVVDGKEVEARLRELKDQPRLIVMSSCQSAGTAEESPIIGHAMAFSALGPRLVEAGVPAVVAMLGSVAMKTTERFMPVFFQELQRDGQIDRAMAVAHGAARDRHDWWMPVLFMRLKSGHLWYERGLHSAGMDSERDSFEKWEALLTSLYNQRCTPVLGSGLIESLLGSSREIALRWANIHHFPMSADDQDELPQVAQFLSVQQDYAYPRDELILYLQRELWRRYGPGLPETLHSATLDELIAAIGAQRREQEPLNPHTMLAHLPCPIYVTTNRDSLLTEALKAAGKQPQVAICPWYEDPRDSVNSPGAECRPDREHPLVYHLFGQLQQPDSLVLTEDDYFDYLIGVTGNNDLIPGVVRRALTDSALLYLGFRIHDWDFRALFRSIRRREGSNRRLRYAHVAVQIDLERDRILEPELARRYLERYFQGADISIYWGTAEEFVRELHKRWLGKYNEDLLKRGGQAAI